MRRLKQSWILIRLSLQSMPLRLEPASVLVICTAGVVGVFLAVLTMSDSLKHAVAGASRADRAIVLAKNAFSEGGSSLPRDVIATIEQAPGIKTAADGTPIASAEAIAVIGVTKKEDGKRAEAVLRGVAPVAFTLRPELKLIAGRVMTPGIPELIVGRAARQQFDGLDVGRSISIRGRTWQIVGVFEAPGNARESELMTDVETLIAAYNRNAYQAVTVNLESPGSFDVLKTALTTNPSIAVDVFREGEFYNRQAALLSDLLTRIAFVVGTLMAIGAALAALNTTYSAVSARAVEIATLRALGFDSPAVAVSVIVEALLLAMLGALVGAAIVYLVVDGSTFSTRHRDGYQLFIELHIDRAALTLSVLWAMAIGFVGAMLPAARAARRRVAVALRDAE